MVISPASTGGFDIYRKMYNQKDRVQVFLHNSPNKGMPDTASHSLPVIFNCPAFSFHMTLIINRAKQI